MSPSYQMLASLAGPRSRLLAGLTGSGRRLPQPLWPSSSSSFHFGVDNWDESTLKRIEADWRRDDRLRKALPTRPKDPSAKPFYVLSMFPYPSGRLHMGHVRVYAISDAIAHFHRMQGKTVIHPMGWDSFGLPAENAAIERGVQPQDWTEKNISSMRDQLDRLGCTFDWDREVSTCSPDYYRWTQAIFVRLMKRGLAYQKESMVNWDPVDETVLADEQVDEEGRSWRSGAVVERRPLRQWFLRTTRFSKLLYEGLDDPSLYNWRDITKLQRHWIGECNGIRINFELTGTDGEGSSSPSPAASVDCWTDRPDLLHSARFVGLAKGHLLDREDLVDKRHQSKELGCEVRVLKARTVHPFSPSADAIPVIACDSAANFPDPFCESYLGAGDADHALADEIGLPAQSDDVPMMTREEVGREARQKGIGGFPCGPRLKDWLVSRQRYWGTPIPVVHCRGRCGGPVPVPEDRLPVELPRLDSICGGKRSPLADARDWVETECPECGGPAERETDTMDTFVDSSWYFLRYLDPANSASLADPSAAASMPVDIYVGGKEHATLHLYYARFVNHFLHSEGVSPVREPFSRLVVQGMVKGKSYRVKGTGRYLREDQVESREVVEGEKKKVRYFERETGKQVATDWEKMSKSKHNGVEPNEVLERYGSDTVKMMMLSGVGPASDRNWSEESYPRMRNLQVRMLKLVSLAVSLKSEQLPELDDKMRKGKAERLWDARNYYLKGINHSYTLTHNLAIVLARIESLVKELWNTPGQVKRDSPEYERALATSIVVLAPVAPHFAAELWSGLASSEGSKHSRDEFLWDKPVFHQPWPTLDPNYNLKLVIRTMGEDLAEVPVAQWKLSSLTEEEALTLAADHPKVREGVLPHPHSHSFEVFPDYEAYLDFSVRLPELSEEEKAAARERRAEEKRLKKERSQKKREERERAEQRKKAKTTSS